MRKVFYALLGIASALAALLALVYFSMTMGELTDALRGRLPTNFPKWDPYAAVGLMGSLCFGAFFMAFRLLHYAFRSKHTDRPAS